MNGFENEEGPIGFDDSPPVQTAPAKNPFDKTILLSVTVKMLGVSKKVDSGAVECDTDKEMIRVSKKILDCDEYDAIRKAVSDLKKMLRARTVPGVTFIKGGIYPIPTSRITEVDARMKDYIALYNAAVARFVEVYEARKEENVAKLKVLGNVADYPPVDQVKKAFGISTEYVTLGPPQSLQSISKEIWERESEKIKEKCMGAATQVQDAMRGIFADLVAHMVERLTPSPDGKKKIFKDTMIGNFKEFIDGFADRNITDDESLAVLVQQAQNILAGKSVDALRKDESVRQSVADSMIAMKVNLDKMIGDRPNRAISIDDAEDAETAPVPSLENASV